MRALHYAGDGLPHRLHQRFAIGILLRIDRRMEDHRRGAGCYSELPFGQIAPVPRTVIGITETPLSSAM